VLFHWFAAGILLISGFKLEALRMMRLFMFGLFALRLFFSYRIVNKIFGKIAALFFVALIFLDPFISMTALQIRPDNLMLTLYTGALLTLINGSYFLTGILLSLSLLVQMKILPSILFILLVFGIYLLRNKKNESLIRLAAGFIIPPLIYSFVYLINGSFYLMVQETFVDSVNLVQSMYNPFSFFYQPYNAYIYGTDGKPFTWIYVWILPLMAVVGSYLIPKNHPMKSILAASPWLQWLLLFFVSSAFIQYFIPFTWLMPIPAAYFLYDLLFVKAKKGLYRNLLTGAVLGLYLVFAVSAIRGNLAHAKLSYLNDPVLNKFQAEWKVIPENSRTFPNILFRQIAFPIIYGYGLQINGYPQSMKEKMPPVTDALEKNRVDYIIVDDMNLFVSIDSRFPGYLENHFRQIEGTNIYKRSISNQSQ
jgi:hypothetical protein